MKTTGIVRKVEKLGRVVLPKSLRDELDLPEETPVEIFIDGEDIVLRKYKKGCVICGNTDNIKIFKNKNICQECIDNITR